MVLEVLRHVSVGHLCQVVVRLRSPAIYTIQLEQKTGLSVIVSVMFFCDAFNITSLLVRNLHYNWLEKEKEDVNDLLG